MPPCWEYPVLCATDSNLRFDPPIWLRSSKDPTVNFKTIYGHQSHKVRTTSTARLWIISSSTLSPCLACFDGQRLTGVRLPPISDPNSYMERSILAGKSLSTSILSSSEEASQASGERELRRIINPAFQVMSQGSRQSFDIHRHKEQAIKQKSGHRGGGTRVTFSSMWKSSPTFDPEWQQQLNTMTKSPLFSTSRKVKLAITPQKFTARTAGTSSLPFVMPPPFTIFNLPDDLLSYHIDQPRAPTKRNWQYDHRFPFSPSCAFTYLHGIW